MAKNQSRLVLGFIYWIGISFLGCDALSQPTTRDRVVSIAESQLHVRELSGRNDGPQVQAFLATTGLKGNYPWCAAFLSWTFLEANIKAPRSAYSPDWFKSNVVYRQRTSTITPFVSKPAQVFGLYFESKGRVAHVGMITAETRLSYSTIEGNTNGDGSREGDGVYRRIRNKKTIYVISDFIPDRP